MSLGERRLIVAFDHAPLGLLRGLERTNVLVADLAKHPLEGIILNYGVLKRLHLERIELPVRAIVRLDGNRTVMGGEWTESPEWELMYSVDACKRIGARAAVVNLLLGGPAEMASLKVVAQAAAACQDAGVPLLVSAIPLRGVNARGAVSCPHAFSARMAYELGADAVSVYGARHGSVLREVSRWCPLPFYAQGAPPTATIAELGTWAKECVDAGARGVVAGQCVWQNPDPDEVVLGLIRALGD